MKTTIQYTIGILFLILTITACGGGEGSEAFPATADQVVGSNWTLTTAQEGNTDVKATFYLQSFNPTEGGALTATVYPNNEPKSGTWIRASDNALTMNIDGGNIQLTNMSINGNTLTASVSIDTGVGGKTGVFSGTATYTK